MPGLDFLAVVSRPDFPTGSGPAGDAFALRRLLSRRADWNAAVVELNSRTTDVTWDGDELVIAQEGSAPFAVSDVGLALYLPICLEVEETLLCPIDPRQRWPRFAEEQWRPITAFFEDRLGSIRCLNRPERVRAANNKLLQFTALRAAGFDLPRTSLGVAWPTGGTSGLRASDGKLVAKNVSEGGWKSPEEFSPARLVDADDALHDPTQGDGWPVLWQEPIDSDRELRAYVMGDAVTVVELARERGVLDVRETNAGRPNARVVSDVRQDWQSTFVTMTRTLGLDYAVIDAIPGETVLHVLEVNANGVWWFLPDDVAAVIEATFHSWLERAVDAARLAR
jgi:hypothetical protein